MARTRRSKRVIKITVNLPEKAAVDLRTYADDNGMFFTTALTEAVFLKLWLEKELAEGSKLLIEKENGTVREVVFAFAIPN